ncbi:MAG: hypothetical protein DWI03_01835 [Planctomycetota bacterium]|jgi:hypothetical protein|nr:MAG: hypothetical protein DWI03_01835 [Planctomycetota bacterium]
MQHTSLVKEVTCPNCWERFPPERVWYVSSHHDLFGDLRLGPNERRRFPPTRFDPEGRALDAKGAPCHELACPRCHLGVPRVFLERPAFFASVFGSPKSGKSYLLASMIHRLRKLLPKSFAIDFSDADPQANAVLHEYEDELFAHGKPDDLVHLKKTDVTGDWYHEVTYGEKRILYPKPFFFQISPVGSHPYAAKPASVARTLCVYDNAGESFQPGADRPDNPVTQHLAKSNCLMFVYDPAQEPEFRKHLQNISEDEQVRDPAVLSRQEVLLAEVARRVKSYRGLAVNARHDRPLLVLVNKYDAWQKLLGRERLPDPWTMHPTGGFAVLRPDMIQGASAAIRQMLHEYMPAVVATAESFVEPSRIVYVPVSATGGPPQRGPDNGYWHRAGSINPMWAEVPMLYALSQFGSGSAAIIPHGVPRSAAADAAKPAVEAGGGESP